MSEKTEPPQLYEPFAVQEIPIDGFFSDARIHGDTFRCTAFSMQSIPGDGQQSQPVAVVRLIIPLRAFRHFIEHAASILSESKASARASKTQRRKL